MASSLAGLARRLVLPADRVAPSHPQSAGETRLWREVTLSGAGVTARLAAATAAAVAEQNNGRGRRWRRVGISVSVAGGAGIGNLATYRRVDLAADGPVEEAVAGALATGGVPPELARPLRALRVLGPVASRLGDSFLVSNLGRHELPGLRDVVFFPVARGRSAVAIGAVALASGSGTVSLRARDLDEADALTLLDEVVKRLS
jgi:hypothetical protein